MQVRQIKRRYAAKIITAALIHYDYCRTRTQALHHFFTLRLVARELGRVQGVKRMYREVHTLNDKG